MGEYEQDHPWRAGATKVAVAVVTTFVVAVVAGVGGLVFDRFHSAWRVDAIAADVVDLKRRMEQQEHRPPRLSPGLDEVRKQCDDLDDVVTLCRERASVIERDVKHIQTEQERLCQRILACPKR